MGAIFVARGLRAHNAVNDRLGVLRDAWIYFDKKDKMKFWISFSVV